MYHMSAYLPSQAWPHSGLWHLGKGGFEGMLNRRRCHTTEEKLKQHSNCKRTPKLFLVVVAIWVQIFWRPGSIWCKSARQQSLKRTSEEAKALCQLWIVGGGETIAASLCPTCDPPPPPPQPTSSSRAIHHLHHQHLQEWQDQFQWYMASPSKPCSVKFGVGSFNWSLSWWICWKNLTLWAALFWLVLFCVLVMGGCGEWGWIIISI